MSKSKVIQSGDMASESKRRKIMTSKIDELPNELFVEIFHHLGVKTLVKCRLVSKKWKSMIDEYRIRELIVYNDEDDCGLMEFTFFHTNEVLNKENLFNGFSADLSLLKRMPWKLDGLKRLKLDGVLIISHNRKNVDISILNTLTALEHLELPILKPKNNFELKLPLLKVLYIFSTGGQSGLTIDCPKLEVFGCEHDMNKINFVHAESIRQIQITSVPRNLQRFKNVEVFRTNNPYFIPIGILGELPNLRELYLDEHKHVHVQYYRARHTMDKLIEQKKQLKKSDLKIYFFNTLLEDGKNVGAYKFYRKYPNAFDDVADGDDTDYYSSSENSGGSDDDSDDSSDDGSDDSDVDDSDLLDGSDDLDSEDSNFDD